MCVFERVRERESTLRMADPKEHENDVALEIIDVISPGSLT